MATLTLQSEQRIKRYTSISGILAFTMIILLEIPLYFMYSGTPPVWNILSRILLSVIAMLFLIVFFIGIQHLIRKKNESYDWHAMLILGAALIYIAITFVSHSLQAGAVYHAGGAADATVDGPLAAGAFLLYGTIGRALTSVYMFVMGYVIFQTRIFPIWTGWMAWVIAFTNLLFIPSLFFGTDESDFYSAVGWGNTAFVASLFLFWVLAVSIAMIRKPKL
ncbi:hypothetical protein [Shimazuella kribbensis]|uniref:hypothetical protein n=1 Tax=Shimazuella kribbensis TaxID=139808 RepID=UPI0005627E14|nr:hypothetical protein [Shimazuella kribbensis]